MFGRILGLVGRALVTVGALLLLFVVYQLWGTGLQEARAQRSLAQEFEDLKASAPALPPVATPTTQPAGEAGTLRPVEVAPVDLPVPDIGDPIATLRIPSIGVTRVVVEGIALSQLKRGPGHYPETPLPGQRGNVSIAGHRTTYGQPFHNIDKLEPGDEITLETLQGTFTYEVSETIIVEPTQVEVLEDFGDNRVTLIACEPKYSAARRIIVVGHLVEDPVPPIAGQGGAGSREGDGELAGVTSGDAAVPESIDSGLRAEPASPWPAILWGLASAAVWALAWTASRAIRTRRADRAASTGQPFRGLGRALGWTPYVIGLPLFTVALYSCFEGVSRLMPAAY